MAKGMNAINPDKFFEISFLNLDNPITPIKIESINETKINIPKIENIDNTSISKLSNLSKKLKLVNL